MEDPQVMPAGDPVPVPSLIPAFDDPELVLQRQRLEKPKPKTYAEGLKIYTKNLTIKNARLCLEPYNKSKGVDYVLDTPLNIRVFHDFSARAAILHSSFTAKKKDSLSGESELFFLESKYNKDGVGLDFITCCIIDPAEIDDPAKVCKSCTVCYSELDPPIYHPVGLHKYGIGQNISP